MKKNVVCNVLLQTKIIKLKITPRTFLVIHLKFKTICIQQLYFYLYKLLYAFSVTLKLKYYHKYIEYKKETLYKI